MKNRTDLNLGELPSNDRCGALGEGTVVQSHKLRLPRTQSFFPIL